MIRARPHHLPPTSAARSHGEGRAEVLSVLSGGDDQWTDYRGRRLGEWLAARGIAHGWCHNADAAWLIEEARGRGARVILSEAQVIAPATMAKIAAALPGVRCVHLLHGVPAWCASSAPGLTYAATFEAGVEGTAKMASAYDELAKSLIDLKVARGEMTKEEAAEAKGTLEIEKLRREAADKVALAERAAKSAAAEARQARQAELEAQRRTVEAEQAVKEAGRSHRERLARAGLQDANAMVIGGLSPFDATAASQTVDLAGGEEAVKQMIAEMEGWTGYMARWRLWLGQSVESVLGAGERAEISRMMAEEASAEIEAAETNLKRAEEAAAKIAEEKARELEDLRREREAAERQAKEAGAGLDRAIADQKIAEDFAVPTARNRTSKELADIESENRERERKAKEKADREREKQEREEAKRRRDAQMAALQAEIKAAAPGLSDRAGRGEAAGFKEGAKALESAAQGFADGASMGELERVLYNTARAIEDAPKRQQDQMRLLLAPLEKAVAGWQRRMETIESQIRNSPNRG